MKIINFIKKIFIFIKSNIKVININIDKLNKETNKILQSINIDILEESTRSLYFDKIYDNDEIINNINSIIDYCKKYITIKRFEIISEYTIIEDYNNKIYKIITENNKIQHNNLSKMESIELLLKKYNTVEDCYNMAIHNNEIKKEIDDKTEDIKIYYNIIEICNKIKLFYLK